MPNSSERPLFVSGATLAPILRAAIPGYKHAATVALAAAVARRATIRFTNLPDVQDITVMLRFLCDADAVVTRVAGSVSVDCRTLRAVPIVGGDVKNVHGPMYFWPAFAGRFGKATLGDTGGCRIGSSEVGGRRPVQHLRDVMQAFGYRTMVHGDLLEAIREASTATTLDIRAFSAAPEKTTGPLVSGATKAAILLGLSSSEPSEIKNGYNKPDVTGLLAVASALGVTVRRANGSVRMEPRQCTSQAQVPSVALPDCVSTVMTWITAAVMTRRRLRLELSDSRALREGLQPELALLQTMGICPVWGETYMELDPPDRISSVDIVVESDGIYSDHQPFFALLLTRGDRAAVIEDRVWRNRYDYVEGLNRLGAEISYTGNAITISPSMLNKCLPVVGRDLRSAATLLIAALSSSRGATLSGSEHLQRGYGRLLDDFVSQGASIQYVD